MIQTIDELLKSSMKIISSAGTGRDFIQQALDSANAGDFTEADTLLNTAYEYLKTAHIEQTKIMQQNMETGDMKSAELLFTHAQDTLMTINSEYMLALKLTKMVLALNERMNLLEKQINEKAK